MKMHKILLFVCFIMVNLSCASEDSETEPVEAQCDRQCQFSYVSDALLDTIRLLYNQNIAGRDIIAPDMLVDCPIAGTAHISGTTTGDPETLISSIELDYELDGCKNSDNDYELTFTGSVNRSGSFRSTGFSALITRSNDIQVYGTVSTQAPAEVEDTCSFSLTEEGDDFETTSVNGEFCEERINY
jgi:hypothetical protein